MEYEAPKQGGDPRGLFNSYIFIKKLKKNFKEKKEEVKYMVETYVTPKPQKHLLTIQPFKKQKTKNNNKKNLLIKV